MLDPCCERVPRAERHSGSTAVQGPAVVRVHRYHDSTNSCCSRGRRRTPAHRQPTDDDDHQHHDSSQGSNYQQWWYRSGTISSCLHHLLPPTRDQSAISRLRTSAKFPKVWLSVFGATQMAQRQRQRRKGKNNRLGLDLGLRIELGIGLGSLRVRLFSPLRRLRCAIWVAPNTESPKVYTRTKHYCSFINYALNNYQDKI